MAGKGPAPTPTALLKLSGTWRGPAREKRGEPQPVRPPDPPRELSPESKAVWGDVFRLLCEMNVLGCVDGFALARYCDLTIAWWALGPDDVDKMVKLAPSLLRLEEQFGMTPAARARVIVNSKPTAKPDGKGRFFGGAS